MAPIKSAESRKSNQKPKKVSFSKAAAKMDPSDLAAFMVDAPGKDNYPNWPEYRLMRFLDYYGRALSGVSCPWHEIFKQSNMCKLFDNIDVPLSHIPESVYKTSVHWLNQRVDDDTLGDFVVWAFDCIISDVYRGPDGWKDGEKPTRKSDVATFVAFAMVLRSKPRVLTIVLPNLRKWLMNEEQIKVALTVWMIAQASQDHFPVALHSWARCLLPVVVSSSNPLLRDLILKLVEKILAKPDVQTLLIDDPVWEDKPLLPPIPFMMLMRLTFPPSSARVKATNRFEAIYPFLKKLALAGATKLKEELKKLFTVSLRLAGEGNPVLAEEATAIAIWSLTEDNVCWYCWENLYNRNLEASVALLKKLVEKLKDGAPEMEAMEQVTEYIFYFSLKLAGEGNPVLAEEATSIAIWSLTKNVVCWKRWDYLYKKNLEASVALLKKLVDEWKNGAPEMEAMEQVTEQIFTFSLKLAGESIRNPVLAEEATAIAIWSLTKNVVCWMRWDYLYKENLEASVALLEKLVDEWKVHSLKPSSSPSDALTLRQTMKSFRLKNKKAITERCSLYIEADKFCEVISWRLSRGSCSLKCTAITAAVLVATEAAGALFFFF